MEHLAQPMVIITILVSIYYIGAISKDIWDGSNA